MKKKLIAVAAAALMVVALAGCASSASSSSASAKASSSASASASGAASYKLVKDGTLTVGISPDYPPFENIENGEIVGFEPDLAAALGEKLGLKVEFASLNFDSILTAVDADTQIDCGISGFSIDSERAKLVDFSTSYFVDDLAIATMKDGGYADAESLKAAGVKIAVQSGTTGESYVQENFSDAEAVAFTNSNDCFAAMAAGKVDAVCTNAAVVSSMVNNSYTDAAVIANYATGEEYGVAVAKSNPELLAAINKALAELSADGTLDKISSKWL